MPITRSRFGPVWFFSGLGLIIDVDVLIKLTSEEPVAEELEEVEVVVAHAVVRYVSQIVRITLRRTIHLVCASAPPRPSLPGSV